MRMFRTTMFVAVCSLAAAFPVFAETTTPEGGTFSLGTGILGDFGEAAGGFLYDSGSMANGSGRTVSGNQIAGGWELFQPFEVPAPGWNVTAFGTDGWEVIDNANVGMLARIHPDDGDGFADESITLASGTIQLGTDANTSNWQLADTDIVLAPGTYWAHWEDNGNEGFWSAVFHGITGLGSISRSQGNLFPAGTTALRIDGTVVPEPTSLALLALGGVAIMSRKRK